MRLWAVFPLPEIHGVAIGDLDRAVSKQAREALKLAILQVRFSILKSVQCSARVVNINSKKVGVIREFGLDVRKVEPMVEGVFKNRKYYELACSLTLLEVLGLTCSVAAQRAPPILAEGADALAEVRLSANGEFDLLS